MDGLPDRHFIDRPPEGAHDLGRHPIGRRRPNQSQLAEHRLRNAFLAFHPQEPAGEIALVSTGGALNLPLAERPPREGGQKLGRPPMLRFPNKPLIIATTVTREGLVGPRHHLSGIAQEDVFQELREQLGQ